MTPQFITLEGTEGVGKTTALTFIRDWLQQRGISVVTTREPGGTPFAEQLRSLLLTPNEEPIAPATELLLMFAARAQHIQQVIRPALTAGQWVLCDRFTDATYAYQGGGRGWPWQEIAHLEALVQRDLQPTVTFWLDAPVELGLTRAAARSAKDRFESEKLEFFTKVHAGYQRRADAEPQRFRRIDASVSVAEVQAQLALVLASLV